MGIMKKVNKKVEDFSEADTYFQEMLMLSKKVDRMERWIMEIAEKVGIKLVP